MSSSDDQAAKVAAALRHLHGEPAQLVNTAGHPVPLAEGPGGGVRATAAPVGRVIVAPAMSVDPDTWGNVVYDQTMMTFASEITRDQQWPRPLEGSRSYLMNQQRTYLRRAGAWRMDPLGHIVTHTGPASPFGGGSATLIIHTMQALGGRRYLFEASATATMAAVSGAPGLTPRCYLVMPSPTGTGNANYFLWTHTTNPPEGTVLAGYTSALYTTPGLAASMSCYLLAVGSWQTVAANAARLTVTELGAT